eukprot:m.53584 g.53584  ORF g.53584 m.53584 type:complete len:411 (+) comp10873_c0_seq2:77-1309(+)
MLARLLAVAFLCSIVSAELSANEKARLQELVKGNEELAQLLRKKVAAPVRERRQEDQVFEKIKLSAVSPFELNERLDKVEKTIQNQSPDDFKQRIAISIKRAVQNSDTLLKTIVAHKEASIEITSSMASIKKQRESLRKAFDDLNETLTGDLEDLAEQKDKLKADIEAQAAEVTKTLTKDLTDMSGDLPSNGAELAARLKLTYVGNPKIPVYRVAWFQTYNNGPVGWFDQNRNRGFGGVTPHDWTDGNARADRIGTDVKYLQSLFTRTRTASSYGAQICADNNMMYSSTTGIMCGALFRIKNTKSTAVQWRVNWVFTAYSGWSERASVAMNKVNQYSSGCSGSCSTTINLNLPPSKTSTIIFMTSTSGAGWGYAGIYLRASINMIVDDSLKLPDGLEYVDDLDGLTGTWN